jgi:hypothetical protein
MIPIEIKVTIEFGENTRKMFGLFADAARDFFKDAIAGDDAAAPVALQRGRNVKLQPDLVPPAVGPTEKCGRA